MLDMIIKGGSIVDGTGAVPVVGDIGIRDGWLNLDALDRLGDLFVGRSGVALSPTAKRLLFSTRGTGNFAVRRVAMAMHGYQTYRE